MKRLKLKAIRRYRSHARYIPNAQDGKHFDESNCPEKEVEITVEYGIPDNDKGGKPIVRIDEGAITGYECFYVENLLRRPSGDGLSWCAGTPCSWDSLRTGPEETERLMVELRKL